MHNGAVCYKQRVDRRDSDLWTKLRFDDWMQVSWVCRKSFDGKIMPQGTEEEEKAVFVPLKAQQPDLYAVLNVNR